ncbi:MAG: J domain-containing protein [Acidimicrobiales bacterium]
MNGRSSKHYQVLGVAPEASMAEIRRAYLTAARTAHPDLHHDSESSRRAAEDRMRRINEAWAVLGDPDERAAYDRQRLRAAAPQPTPRHHRSRHSGDDFRPFDAGPDEAFDDADDRPITDSALPRWLTVAPAVLLVGGLSSILFGAILGAGQVIGLGVVSIVVAGVLLLVAAPIVALGRAARGERRTGA